MSEKFTATIFVCDRSRTPSPSLHDLGSNVPLYALWEGGSGERWNRAVLLGLAQSTLRYAYIQARGTGQETKQAENRLKHGIPMGYRQPNTPLVVPITPHAALTFRPGGHVGHAY